MRNPDGSPDALHSPSAGAAKQVRASWNSRPDVAGERRLQDPTPTFGAGLIEMIPDSAILANRDTDSAAKSALGIRGRANSPPRSHRLGPDEQQRQRWNRGAVWVEGPEQVPAALLGRGLQRGDGHHQRPVHDGAGRRSRCDYADNPNSITDPDAPTPIDAINSIEKFTFFMRFLAPPTPSATTPGGATSITNGKGKPSLPWDVRSATLRRSRLESQQSQRCAQTVRSTRTSCCTHGHRAGRRRQPGEANGQEARRSGGSDSASSSYMMGARRT